MKHSFSPCFQLGLALAFGEAHPKSSQKQRSPVGETSTIIMANRLKLQKILSRAEQEAEARWGSSTATIARRMVTVWVDEILMSAPWPGRNEWLKNPLQSEWREGRTGGLWFFRQLTQLRSGQHDDRQLAALALRCLSLGLTGCYGRSPDKIMAARHGIQKKFNFRQDSPVFPPPLPVTVKKKFSTFNASAFGLLLVMGLACLWLFGNVHLNSSLAQVHREIPTVSAPAPTFVPVTAPAPVPHKKRRLNSLEGRFHTNSE